jgi:Ca2+-binding EF-hand superfamily protein
MIATGASIALAQPAPLDTDRSTSVSEMKQRHAERFNRMDADKDGQLTQEEMQAGRQDRRMGGFGGRGLGMRPRGPGGPGGPGAMLQGADANRDGVVTREEFTAQALDRFQQLDANRDGRVAADELQAARPQFGGRRGGGRFAMLDADRNGSISRAEFDLRFAERLERLDANKDGTITVDERRAGRGRPGARP